MNSLVDGLFTSLGFSAVPVYHPNPGRFLESLWFSVNSASLEMLALTSVMESAAARSAARGRWKVKQVKGKIASFYLTPPFVIGGGTYYQKCCPHVRYLLSYQLRHSHINEAPYSDHSNLWQVVPKPATTLRLSRSVQN